MNVIILPDDDLLGTRWNV